ncbi:MULTISPECIES: DUF3618 domain-containing protein [unclassified Streptomyces]|uniref:DUF3618 domain-containing protein n=1 Tax=unclassified Streptomyces TaxID=2593676 RepID=UPI0006AF38BC|nr:MULTISPECIES: DUF3618 domain-containing protein [unclassified Streptomyces]KOU95654.1 hypothetical protein ADK93_04575 [Streptomyces sp. XY58]KOV00422.1 hypothetical protein ADK89_33490 [Streptomyces sp. XY37]KOV40759.1 hypothetical protein ADK99_33610 [Streptomyces sp. MMG1064]
MNDDARTHIGTPSPSSASSSPAELRDQVERTRDELGQTIEALAGKADIKAQAKEKSAAVKGQAVERAAMVADQIRQKREQAAQLVKNKTPDPLRERAGHAATVARANRIPLLAVGATVVALLLVRRSRGSR